MIDDVLGHMGPLTVLAAVVILAGGIAGLGVAAVMIDWGHPEQRRRIAAMAVLVLVLAALPFGMMVLLPLVFARLPLWAFALVILVLLLLPWRTAQYFRQSHVDAPRPEEWRQ